MKKNVVIVHYNTPVLTLAAIKSARKHTPGCEYWIFDNSDALPFTERAADIKYIDNTKGQIVDWEKWLDTFEDKEPSIKNNYGSAKHCFSVDYMFDKLPDGFVLMDSDVLITHDFSSFFDDTKVFVGNVRRHQRCCGKDILRVRPMLCWLNVPMCREYGIRYFEKDHIYNLTSQKPYCRYDTGAWFYEECMRHNLPNTQIELEDYIIHFEHGSWSHRNPNDWLRRNMAYYV